MLNSLLESFINIHFPIEAHRKCSSLFEKDANAKHLETASKLFQRKCKRTRNAGGRNLLLLE